MRTLRTSITCHKVNMTLNSIIITIIVSDLAYVHIGVVGQSLVHEGDIRKGVWLYTSPTDQQNYISKNM